MPKKEKGEEVSGKDYKNLMEKLNKLENEFNELKGTPKAVNNLEIQVNKIQEKLTTFKSIPKSIQNIINRVSNLENDLTLIREDIELLKKEITTSQDRIEQTIQTQEEIIMDMIAKFNDEFLKNKSQMAVDIKEIKNQQDILKISYSINENKLMANIQKIVNDLINRKIEGKESEILMKIWIDEFKEILSDFENLKKLNPKEFSTRLNEISNTIDMFKQKIMIE